jgi:hypothetical protein
MIMTIRVPHASIYDSASLPEYKEYYIHASLLATPYFQELVFRAKSTKQKSDRIITLDSIRTDYFDVYADWLHHNSIRILHSKPKYGELSQEEARTDYANLLGCYSLGTILHDTLFLDALASQLIHTLQQPHTHQSQLPRLLTVYAVDSIIESYTTSSPLYLLLVSAYARFASTREIEILAYSEYDSRFKSAVMAKLGLLRGRQHVDGAEAGDFVVGECKFHWHGFYESCSVRKRR